MMPEDIPDTISIACSASGSVNGQFNVDTYASIACVKASIPVYATCFTGSPATRSGSTIATSGVILKSASGYFTPV